MKYAVLISAGHPTDYGRKVGWDDPHDTREAAEAQRERAERNDGWTAKVVTVSERDAAHWHETVAQRLERERAELDASVQHPVNAEMRKQREAFEASIRHPDSTKQI